MRGGGIIASFVFHLFIGVDVGYSTIQYWLPVYLMGAVLGFYYEKSFCSYIKEEKVCLFVGGLCMFVLIIMAKKNSVIYYFYRLVAPVLLWIIFDFFKKFPELKWWMKCTVFYYGMHIVVISSVAKGYRRLVGTNTFLLIMANMVIPIVCIFIMVCMAAVIRKGFPPLWGLMTGGRE